AAITVYACRHRARPGQQRTRGRHRRQQGTGRLPGLPAHAQSGRAVRREAANGPLRRADGRRRFRRSSGHLPHRPGPWRVTRQQPASRHRQYRPDRRRVLLPAGEPEFRRLRECPVPGSGVAAAGSTWCGFPSGQPRLAEFRTALRSARELGAAAAGQRVPQERRPGRARRPARHCRQRGLPQPRRQRKPGPAHAGLRLRAVAGLQPVAGLPVVPALDRHRRPQHGTVVRPATMATMNLPFSTTDRTRTMRSRLARLLTLACLLALAPPLRANDLVVGQAAPPIVLHTFDGHRIDTRDLHGKVIILTFWATWCAPCREELPLLSRYAQLHAHDGLVVLGFSLDTPEQRDEARAIARSLSFPSGLLGDPRVPGYGRIWRLPVSFVIGRDGRLTENGWKDKTPAWTAD